MTFEPDEDLFTLARLDDQPADEAGPAASAPANNEQLVLSVLSTTELSRMDIEECTGLKAYQVLRALQSLRERGLVRMIGQPRSRSARYIATTPS